MNCTHLLAICLLTLTVGCTYKPGGSTPPPTPPPKAASTSTKAAGPVSTAGATVAYIDLSKLSKAEDPTATTQPGFTKTNSGLQYRVLREGDGLKPTVSNEVVVHYKGQLLNGQEFDSSYKRNQTISFPLGGVIPGWTEGMQLVGEGGMIELLIPAELGYGSSGQGDIPSNSTLQFIVELQQIK